MTNEQKRATRAVHAGVYADSEYGSVTTPVYTSSTYRFEAIGKQRRYDYGRSGNPTRNALEENLASLEGGAGCTATATGMAAVTTIMFLLRPGDHVITGNDIYGGTYRLFSSIFGSRGISFSFVNMANPDEVRAAVGSNTKMIWIETPSNPLVNLTDIEAIVAVASEHGLLTVADNTFLSPWFQRPLDFGVDYVIHSTTKYLNGHSDVVGGAVVSRRQEQAEHIAYLANALGFPQAPFDTWLVLRGVKTLGVRMRRHEENAERIAEYLSSHSRVTRVYYTGLPDHPQREIAAKQMTGHGGMLSFNLDDKAVSVSEFCSKLSLITLAESLGGVESLVEHPWTMSHASMGEEGLAASGISETTIRMSVGIEDAQDLIDDLTQALG